MVPGTLGGALREGHGVRWTGCTERDARDGMRWAVGDAAERRVRLDRGMACAEQDARDKCVPGMSKNVKTPAS